VPNERPRRHACCRPSKANEAIERVRKTKDDKNSRNGPQAGHPDAKQHKCRGGKRRNHAEDNECCLCTQAREILLTQRQGYLRSQRRSTTAPQADAAPVYKAARRLPAGKIQQGSRELLQRLR
jgi:hypothetical protein